MQNEQENTCTDAAEGQGAVYLQSTNMFEGLEDALEVPEQRGRRAEEIERVQRHGAGN